MHIYIVTGSQESRAPVFVLSVALRNPAAYREHGGWAREDQAWSLLPLQSP